MRTHLVAWLVVLTALAATSARAEIPVSAPARHASRYIYCNVYLDDACFGIASGDTLKMEIPVDFVLDTVSLWNGVKVVIYEGHNPEDTFGGKTAMSCPAASDAHQCQYKKSAGQYDLLYQATANSQIIHLRITGITLANQAGVADFLSGFRRCRVTGQSEQCTDERIFNGID
jgi:hypothetical protein